MVIDGPLEVEGSDTCVRLPAAARRDLQQLTGLRTRSPEHLRAVTRLTVAGRPSQQLRVEAHDREQLPAL